MRMRKKKNLIPRMERCGACLVTEHYDMPGKWRDLMPGARELRLELGCGKGRFTAGVAAAEPDVLLIAVELNAHAVNIVQSLSSKGHHVADADLCTAQSAVTGDSLTDSAAAQNGNVIFFGFT